MSRKRSKRRRKKRSGIAARLFGFLLVASLLVALAAVTFQLQNLVITGNVHVTADEVKAVVLSAPTGGNTVLTKLFNTNRQVKGNGFISRVDAKITDRNTVAVTVTEHRFVGVLKEDDNYWYIRSDGTAQASAAKRRKGEKLPLINGLTLTSRVKLGTPLPIQGTKPFVLLDSLKSMTDLYDIVPDAVEFASDGSMSLIYGGVTVMMGDGTNLEGRMKELAGILEKMDGSYNGILHLERFERSGSPIVFDQN